MKFVVLFGVCLSYDSFSKQLLGFSLVALSFSSEGHPFFLVSSFLGCLFCALFFLLGFCISQFCIADPKWKNRSLSFLTYLFLAFIALFLMNRFGFNWGLRWYSLMYLSAFTVVYFGCLYWIKKKTLMLTESSMVTMLFYCIIGMLLSARAAYVFIYNWDYYKDHPLWEMLATWKGGLSFHGGIVGVCLAFWVFVKKHNIPYFHLTDKIVRLVPVGIALGRIGNFMNGELWGREISTPIPWAVVFPEAGPYPRHPSQIYQSLGEGVLLFLTLFFLSRWKQREGTLSSFFIIFYCIYRFIVEYFRSADEQVNYFYLNYFEFAPLHNYPDTPWWQIVTMGQILCVAFFIMGVGIFFLTRNNIREGSTQWTARMERFLQENRSCSQ